MVESLVFTAERGPLLPIKVGMTDCLVLRAEGFVYVKLSPSIMRDVCLARALGRSLLLGLNPSN